MVAPARQIQFSNPIAGRLWRILVPIAHLVGVLLVAVTWSLWVAAIYIALLVSVGAWRSLRRARTRGRRQLRFTQEGRYLVLISLGIGFAAINTGNNLLYLMLGMLLSIIIVSGILSEHTLRKLVVRRVLPDTAFAGRPFLVGVIVENQKSRAPSYSVQVEDVLREWPNTKKCYFLKVGAKTQQQTSYRAVFQRRGEHGFESFEVGTRFPFGFFAKSRRHPLKMSLIVFPCISPVRDLPTALEDAEGDLTAHRPGPGTEFHGLRDYRMGDDARNIHWKRSARTGRLVLRELERDGSRRLRIVLNHRLERLEDAEATLPALDHCIDLAASLAAHFADNGVTVSVQAGSEVHQLGQDRRGLNSLLRWLALLDFQTGDSVTPPGSRARESRILVTPRATRHLAANATYVKVYERD